jgi:hypothetical protein
MKYPIHISSKSKYCWFKIPKCASCTITEHLNKHSHKFNNDKNEWIQTEYKNEYKNFTNFAFVRNPYERLVSCWADKILNHEKWSHEHTQSKEIHYMINRNFSFREFILKITDSFENTDGHWCPMIKFLPSDFDKFILIGKLENFKNDFDIVCKKIGIPCTDYKQIHKTKRKSYTEYYDEETYEIVTQKYAEDIKQFGYEFGIN